MNFLDIINISLAHVYCSTTLSNHRLIRLKRFISQINRKLCNQFYNQSIFNTLCMCLNIRCDRNFRRNVTLPFSPSDQLPEFYVSACLLRPAAAGEAMQRMQGLRFGLAKGSARVQGYGYGPLKNLLLPGKHQTWVHKPDLWLSNGTVFSLILMLRFLKKNNIFFVKSKRRIN